MICTLCETKNPETANRCVLCDTPLHNRERVEKRQKTHLQNFIKRILPLTFFLLTAVTVLPWLLRSDTWGSHASTKELQALFQKIKKSYKSHSDYWNEKKEELKAIILDYHTHAETGDFPLLLKNISAETIYAYLADDLQKFSQHIDTIPAFFPSTSLSAEKFSLWKKERENAPLALYFTKKIPFFSLFPRFLSNTFTLEILMQTVHTKEDELPNKRLKVHWANLYRGKKKEHREKMREIFSEEWEEIEQITLFIKRVMHMQIELQKMNPKSPLAKETISSAIPYSLSLEYYYPPKIT